MANHKSAKKRHRQSERKRVHHQGQKAAVRTAIKRTRAAAEEGNREEARLLFARAEKLLAKAATKGLYHRRNAARRISRLAQLVSGAGS